MSKLTGIYLCNFQSIKGPAFFPLDKLTFFYGPNSAGKSSILDAIELLKKTVNASGLSTGQTKLRNIESHYGMNENPWGQLSVGAEIQIGDFDRGLKEVCEWEDSEDRNGESGHNYFFQEIRGKKVQIEYSNHGNCIKVAIDSRPYFEINGYSMTPYDDLFKKLDGEKAAKYEWIDERHITGQLKIYKNNPFYGQLGVFCEELSNYDRELKKSHFYDLFIEETDEYILVNGVSFSSNLEFQTYFSQISRDAQDLLYADYKDIKDFSVEDENIELYEKFLRKEFLEGCEDYDENNKTSRHRLARLIEAWATDYSKLCEGFIYQLMSSLATNRVRGDRQVLNSKNYFSNSYREGLGLGHRPVYFNFGDGQCKFGDPSASYARFLAKLSKNKEHYESSVIKGDFVNFCFDKILVSLKGYRIVSDAYDILSSNQESRGDKESNVFGGIVFLSLEDKAKVSLGFEDVGSGISYVFPILTSLWEGDLSFIEQPELHLHPAAQCEMADVFIWALNQGSRAIVETHSEHILLRVLRRIRETNKDFLLNENLKLTPEQIAIYYFKPEPGGYTVVKEIRVDGYGELLTPWPGGFFSERDRELFDE